jgi:hypothetical protein
LKELLPLGLFNLDWPRDSFIEALGDDLGEVVGEDLGDTLKSIEDAVFEGK